jgi:hypothetical protein
MQTVNQKEAMNLMAATIVAGRNNYGSEYGLDALAAMAMAFGIALSDEGLAKDLLDVALNVLSSDDAGQVAEFHDALPEIVAGARRLTYSGAK